MNLTPIKANMTVVHFNGLDVLFSYKTPVACMQKHMSGMPQYFKTDKKWSRTTSRHINQWLGGYNGIEKPQEYFDNLLKVVR